MSWSLLSVWWKQSPCCLVSAFLPPISLSLPLFFTWILNPVLSSQFPIYIFTPTHTHTRSFSLSCPPSLSVAPTACYPPQNAVKCHWSFCTSLTHRQPLMCHHPPGLFLATLTHRHKWGRASSNLATNQIMHHLWKLDDSEDHICSIQGGDGGEAKTNKQKKSLILKDIKN